MKKEINILKNYAAKSDRTKNDKNKVPKNVKLPYNGIKKGFEDGDFLINYFGKQAEKDDSEQPTTSKDGQQSEVSEVSEESKQDEIPSISKEVNLDWIYGTKKK